MNEQEFQRDLASYAHEQDLYKHTATLSTGALVLLTTFLDKLFTHPTGKTWIGIALISFVGSIVGSVAMQLMSVLHVSKSTKEQLTGTPLLAFWVALLLTFGGFLLGILCLLQFALINLHPW